MFRLQLERTTGGNFCGFFLKGHTHEVSVALLINLTLRDPRDLTFRWLVQICTPEGGFDLSPM